MSRRFVKEHWPRTVEVEKGTECPAGSLEYLNYDTSKSPTPDFRYTDPSDESPYYYAYPAEATECSRKRLNGERSSYPGVF